VRYVPALDGVRGVAVLLVVLFHFGYLNAGWVGVQIFFVLSGFLITRILVEDRGAPFWPSLGKFYWRRSLRIVPLYLAFVSVLAACFLAFGEPRSFAWEWPYLCSYTANFARAQPGDMGPYTIHLWSLAVEEQFYFVWPALLLLLPERAFKRAIAGILVLAPVVRLLLFVAVQRQGHGAEYAGRLVYSLPLGQFDAFATGAAVTLWQLDRRWRAGRAFVWALAATAALGAAILVGEHLRAGDADGSSLGYAMYMTAHYQFVWGYTLLNVVSALGIICVLQRAPALRWLEWRRLVRVGRVSYGVYVYHLPILVLATAAAEGAGIPWNAASRAVLFPFYVAAVVLVSEASFEYLERPFLNLKDYWAERRATRPGVVPAPDA
jgi:peptidoglycan/LPS O-acetylase OafA/YrhL